ncbi:MAG: glycine dehydrogenase, partial [Thermaurantiacus sp.]
SRLPTEDLGDLVDRIDADTSAVVVQYPDVFGHVADLSALAEACHAKGALLVVVVTEVVALGLIRSPGEMGADIVVGEGQSLGVGLQFGGPHLGLFATRERFVRQMPGRLCGETVDAEGRRGFVLTLSTREQHIRREKATSNICTNSGLMSLAFTIHLALLGEKGLRHLAALNHARACETAERLAAIPGVKLLTDCFFNEFALKLPIPARQAVRDMAEMGVLGGVSAGRLWPDVPELENVLLVAATECVSAADIDALARALTETAGTEYSGA